MVDEDLIKHASEEYNFELKTVAYRRARTENNGSRILVFVENAESFAFLHNESNWPQVLTEHTFTMNEKAINSTSTFACSCQRSSANRLGRLCEGNQG
jgi:hypothetical protein